MHRLIGAVVPLGLLILLSSGCSSQKDPKLDSIARADGMANPDPTSPNQFGWGDLAGGERVNVLGRHFTHDSQILIDGQAIGAKLVIGSNLITGIVPQATSVGFKEVRLNSRNGHDDLPGGWEYRPGPVGINSNSPPPGTNPGITPNIGDISGGTLVTLSGTGLVGPDAQGLGGTIVEFGSAPGIVSQLVSPVYVDINTIQGFTPPSPNGIEEFVDVTVRNSFGTDTLSNGYEYAICAGVGVLTITGINPAQGPLSGGTRVTISGTNLASGALVLIDGRTAQYLTFASDGVDSYAGAPCAIVVDTPPGSSAGVVDVEVRSGTEVATLLSGFTYTAVSIASVTPSQGPQSGNTRVTLTGSGFTPGTLVEFGGVPGTAGLFINFNSFEVSTPPSAIAGFVDVQVTNPNGVDVLPGGFEYLPIAISSIVPNFDTLQGGSSIVISGTGLNSVVRVLIGANELINTAADPAGFEITGVVPLGAAAGPVDVTIAGPPSLGDATLSNGFVYNPGPPLVYEVTPNFGPRDGGGLVTITGENFTTAPLPLGIRFDGGTGGDDGLADTLDVAVANTDILNTRTIQVLVPSKRPPAGSDNLEVVEVGAFNGIGLTMTQEAYAYAEWESPGPLGGFITDIEVHPSSGNIVYAGISGLGRGGTGGLYRSSTAGGSWERREAGLIDTNVNALVIDPSQPLTLYAGTPSGLYFSDDEGLSWSPVSDPDLSSRPIISLAIHPSLLGTLWAGSEASIVYVTSDGGATSAATVVGTGNFDVRALAVTSSGQDVFAGTGGDGIFRSNLGGAWAPASSGLGVHTYILSLQAERGSTTRVYAGTIAGGVYVTNDLGGSWVQGGAMPPSTTPSVYDLVAVQANQVYAAVDDVGGLASGVWFSGDAGVTWTEVSGDPVAGTTLELSAAEAEMRSLAIDGTSPNTLYGGAIGGLFKTTNSGTDWNTSQAGISNTNVRSYVRSATGTTYAGTFGAGVFWSPDGGQTWNPGNGTPPTLTATRVQAMALGGVSGDLYAGTSDGGVYMSLDSGFTWTQENNGLGPVGICSSTPVDPLDSNDITSIAITPGIDNVVYIGTNGEGVWGTAAGGTPGLQWCKLPGDPANGPLTEEKIRVVTVSTSIDRQRGWNADPTQTIYPIRLLVAGTDGGGLFASTNGGALWQQLNSGLQDLDVRDVFVGVEIIVDPEQPLSPTRLTDNFYFLVGTGGGGVARGSAAISINVIPGLPGQFRAELENIVWTPMNNGLDNSAFPNALFVNALAVDPIWDTNVFAGTDGDGVFVTGNGGVSWIQLDPGTTITNPIVESLGLVFDGCSNCTTILAGTAGGGSNRIRILKQ